MTPRIFVAERPSLLSREGGEPEASCHSLVFGFFISQDYSDIHLETNEQPHEQHTHIGQVAA